MDKSDLTFTWNVKKSIDDENPDEIIMEEVELIDNGKEITITNENRYLFVDKVYDILSYK